jgi:hypothetical protein
MLVCSSKIYLKTGSFFETFITIKIAENLKDDLEKFFNPILWGENKFSSKKQNMHGAHRRLR